jgi:molybdopterin converting factor small subunit
VIEVEVSLFAPLREGRFSRAMLSLEPGTTVVELLQHLGIRKQEVESVYINSREGTFAQELRTGDRISLLPVIGGG